MWSLSENQRGELLTANIAAGLSAGGGKPGQGYPAVLIAPQESTGLENEEPPPAVAGDAAASTAPAEGDIGGGRNRVAVSGTLTARVGKGPNSTGDDGTLLLQPGAASNPPRADRAEPTLPHGARPASSGSPQPTGQGECPLVMVRRLTPTECERLQGFPDQWTATGANGRGVSDTARYRLVGNAATVSVVAWIGARLQAAHHASPATPDRNRRATDPAGLSEQGEAAGG